MPVTVVSQTVLLLVPHGEMYMFYSGESILQDLMVVLVNEQLSYDRQRETNL